MQRINPTLILALVLILGIVAYIFFVPKSPKSSLKDSDFAILDTTLVAKIEMKEYQKDKVKRTFLLQKTNNGWRVNDKYPALEPQVHLLLKTLTQVRVKEPLTPAANETALTWLANKHQQIEVLDKDGNVLKSYEIGPEAKDHMGSIMKLSGTDKAYVVSIPGVDGYLNGRYAMDEGLWRENLLFDGTEAKIKQIIIEAKENAFSFSLQRTNAQSPWTVSGQKADSARIRRYLSAYTGKVYAETFAAPMYPTVYDELKNQTPDVRMQIVYWEGNPRIIRLYGRPDNKNSLFGWVEGENQLLTIQHFVIDKFLML